MDRINRLLKGEEKIAIVGLGYVGIQVAVEFAKKVQVIGYDVDYKKIKNYKLEIHNKNLFLTTDREELSDIGFYIITVPTPVDEFNIPDLSAVKSATETVAKKLKKGAVIVYESTVYPGVTEEVCIPILERESGLSCGTDFKVGYSPERITPGDNEHTISKVTKIVSGMDKESEDIIKKVYEIILGKEGIYLADSIKVAEAAKLLENTQRDVLIALMNEAAIVFKKLNIDIHSVIEAAATKWNFSKVSPGLVGGHCIGVDPYYLIYKADMVGCHLKLVTSGREINENVAYYIVDNLIKQLIKSGKEIKNNKILILGVAYKANVKDTRNSKVINIINRLKEYLFQVEVADYLSDNDEVLERYGLELTDIKKVHNVDAIICAVPHEKYTKLNIDNIEKIYRDQKGIFIDITGAYKESDFSKSFVNYWRM